MKVSVLKCDQYDLELVKAKIEGSLKLLNCDQIIKKDDRVFIKLNCLGPFDKEAGITTHPVFVQAVIQIVKKYTNNIIVGDNPATKNIIPTMKKNGIYDVLIAEGVEIIDGKKSINIKTENYTLFNAFDVSEEMINVDVMINLPKLKTHALAYMTVAQKNLFGFIYGLSKAGWHVRASNPLQFGEALNDLYAAILDAYKDKTIIHICDGILGLEGEGPGISGKPKNGNVIIASQDAISLDRVAVEVAGLDYDRLFINKIGNERKLGIGNLEEIEILGDGLDEFVDLQFVAPKNTLSIFGLKLLKIKWLRNIVLEHPSIDHSKCIKCGECAKICSSKAMTIEAMNYPKVKKNICIRCWCCCEVCPQDAISKSTRPLLGKILLKNRN
jgi:uncharacterized protein (DUF362 family)/Pyruvate/2-oxoacid:ferredoxin oxidoreductase delta subunit